MPHCLSKSYGSGIWHSCVKSIVNIWSCLMVIFCHGDTLQYKRTTRKFMPLHWNKHLFKYMCTHNINNVCLYQFWCFASIFLSIKETITNTIIIVYLKKNGINNCSLVEERTISTYMPTILVLVFVMLHNHGNLLMFWMLSCDIVLIQRS